ncbi:MAG: amidohydrolase family protein [Betaproteobacteria bacterium]
MNLPLQIPMPISPTRKPDVMFPKLACDSHAHIFGPLDQYPILPQTHFIPNQNPWSEYVKVLNTLGCERAVLVQPSVYGTNNKAIFEALESRVFDLRAVAVVSPDITDQELEKMHMAGFRGIRINTASATQGLRIEDAPRLAQRIKHMGWHLQFFVNFRKTPELALQLKKLPINIVIDHFACVDASLGLDSTGCKALLDLLEHDHCWAKLMGPYFTSTAHPKYQELLPIARAMVQVAPDRLVWGTDWPHPSARERMPNDGDLADLLAQWAGDEKDLQKILVTNPARLYDFA